jgi:predicted flavoprotein YhiN
MEEWLLGLQRQRATSTVAGVLAARLPAAVGAAFTRAAGIDADTTLAHLDRDRRRALVHMLVEQPLKVRDSRGYNYAEVTAGGVPLDEVDARTMESTICPGLYLVGEILDVDGRLGGFNFQWAWSSAFVAGGAIGRRLRRDAL